MFYLLFIGFFTLVALVCFFLWQKLDKDGDVPKVFGWIAIILAILFFVIGLIDNTVCYSSQLKRFESIKMVQNNIGLLEDKNAELIGVFTKHLAIEFPELEREIFKDLSPGSADENLNALLGQYPDPQSSETLSDLTDKIYLLTERLYEEKLLLEEKANIIRVREVSPWILTLPDIPNYLQNVIYSE